MLKPIALVLTISTFQAFFCDAYTISTAEDLISFSKSVNNGQNYSGQTVFLGADIDFTASQSNEFEAIGREAKNCFKGVFDGQGHVIRNLAINSKSQHSGPFGYSNGATIKNIVLDESCSITSDYVSAEQNFSSVGGIIGFCETNGGPCSIENNVVMAKITSKDDIREGSFIGGIAGILSSEGNHATIKNCINYGTVQATGRSEYLFIGGIAGSVQGNQAVGEFADVQNCANYGNLVKSSGVAKTRIGGISGFDTHSNIENCVSSGAITATLGSEDYAGGIVGRSEYSNVLYCYWTNDVGSDKLAGLLENSLSSQSRKLAGYDTVAQDVLNKHASSRGLATWSRLVLNGGKINGIDQDSLVVVLGHFMTPEKKGSTFLYWCTDSECKEKYNPSNPGTSKSNALFVKLFGDITKSGLIKHVERIHGFAGRKEEEGRKEGRTAGLYSTGNNPTFYAHWRKNSNPGPIIAGVVCAVVAVVIAVVIVFVFIVRRRKTSGGSSEYIKVGRDFNASRRSRDRILDRQSRGNRYSMKDRQPRGRIRGRIPMTADPDTDFEFAGESTITYAGLYPAGYEEPTLPDALQKARLDDEQVSRIMEACNTVAVSAEQRNGDSNYIGYDAVAAIAMYTFSFGENESEKNPHRLINMALIENSTKMLKEVRGAFFHVMRSLRKLPRCAGKTLYRGMRDRADMELYASGKTIVWHGISSTSTDEDRIKELIGEGGCDEGMESRGTLFVIEDAWGYDIREYSLFPDDGEILLEPERKFVVKSVTKADSIIVKLRMLDTPLLFPEVFGE